MAGKVSPVKGPVPSDLMNEQLQAELDHIRKQWESDQLVLQEANKQLTDRNLEINKQNQNIKDSISYAKRIQTALLPPEVHIQELFYEYFLFY